MAEVLEKIQPLMPKSSSRGHLILKYLGVIVLVILVTAVIVFGASAAYISYYSEKVYPGIYAGTYHLGGSTEKEVNKFIEDLNNRLTKEGVAFNAKNDKEEIAFRVNVLSGGDSGVEIVSLDGAGLAKTALLIDRDGSWYKKLFSPIMLRFKKKYLSVPVQVNELAVAEILQDNLKKLSDDPKDANVLFPDWPNGRPVVTTESSGQKFDTSEIIEQLKNDLSQLRFNTINLKAKYFSPSITGYEAESIVHSASDILEYGNLSLNYIDPQSKSRREWVITAAQLGQWLRLRKDDTGAIIFTLDKNLVDKYLDDLRLSVEVPAQDAKFVMENGKVKEFQASRIGVTIDMEKTFADLAKAFEERNYHPSAVSKTIGLTATAQEPKVQMSSLNDLGIEGIIGSGVSSFVGSHTNRIKNIANAVKALNGILIKPGEEFSTTHYSGPFTEENGFLPELVIKGNEIKEEIGGGMCQIGTTMFRMAMNSGMDITQRRNHSLVVSYYADPVNGNPGTDATLYEPSLDLKFLNDTGAYLLLQTEMDYKKQQLTFTLWGKLDGRKGWYTHPVVIKWIPPGEKQVKYTDTLKPGEETCQAAYKGAEASFMYTRVTTSGVKIDREFESFYRALPKICLVGAPTVTNTPAVAGEAPAVILEPAE